MLRYLIDLMESRKTNIAGIILLLVMISCQPEKEKTPPNFLFILVDDLGWTDLGCYGSTFYETPNIDSFSKKATKFTDAYAACPVCSPTRASIMTGLYERTHEFTFGTSPLKQKFVDISYPLLLKKNGYITGFIGKLGMRFENNLDTTLFDFYERHLFYDQFDGLLVLLFIFLQFLTPIL